MKTKNLFCLPHIFVAAIFFLAASAAFSFPFTDAINYTIGAPLTGQNNPEGNAWAAAGTNVGDMFATNITITYPGLPCPATNSIQFGNIGVTERVAIAPATTNGAFILTNGTIYYSYVFLVTNLAQLNTSGGFVCGFNNLVGPQAAQPSTVGSRLYMRLSAINTSSGYNVGIGKNPSGVTGASWATNEFVVGQTNFIVASYTFVASGTSNDIAQLWVNPDPATFGASVPPTPDQTNIIGNDLLAGGANQLESFMFRQGNAQIPIILATDLRIGTNWTDVAPSTNTPVIPTATSLHVVASGGNAVITWPTNNHAGFRLQGTPTLVSGTNAWTNVSASTNVVSTNYTVSDPIHAKNYYRLIYP